MDILELFAGVGSPRKALKNLNIDHEVVAFSEIDKHAIESYRAIHDDYVTPNLGDIKEISYLPPCDLLTYGFPCQDISVAGKGKGIAEGTRSGLLFEVERLLEIGAILGTLPKYLILENVKALTQKKHRQQFDEWLEKLESLGYTNYYQVLNAKDYGVPQNRERVFVISILGDHKPFVFPEKQELNLRLRDLLEDEVEERYYLKDEKTQEFIEKYKDKIINLQEGIYPCLTPERLNKRQNGRRFKNENEDMFTITATDKHGVMKIGSLTDSNSQGERVYTADVVVTQNANGGGMGAKTGLYLVGNVNPSGKGMNGSVFSEEGICPTLTTNKGEGIKIIGSLDIGGQRGRIYDINGTATCLGSSDYKDPQKILVYDMPKILKVRKNEVDIKRLKALLRENKIVSIKEISDKLNKSVSLVEHWFRKDECFSIPDPDIWLELKKLLNIKTNEFDESIMEFEEKVSVYEKGNRVYDEKGISPTLTTNEKIEILTLGNIEEWGQKGRAINADGLVPTLISSGYGGGVNIYLYYRIRRLTPVECFRLMGFTDIDFYRAKEKLNETFYKGRDNSDSQLYKQAGNSIVVNVLEAIFRNLFLEEEVSEYKLF